MNYYVVYLYNLWLSSITKGRTTYMHSLLFVSLLHPKPRIHRKVGCRSLHVHLYYGDIQWEKSSLTNLARKLVRTKNARHRCKKIMMKCTNSRRKELHELNETSQGPSPWSTCLVRRYLQSGSCHSSPLHMTKEHYLVCLKRMSKKNGHVCKKVATNLTTLKLRTFKCRVLWLELLLNIVKSFSGMWFPNSNLRAPKSKMGTDLS